MATAAYQQADDLDGLFDDNDNGDVASTPFDDMDQSFGTDNVQNDNADLDAIFKEAGVAGGIDLDTLNQRELEDEEKADDAMDYGDLSDDDDLPDEELPSQGGPVQPLSEMLPGITDSAMLDDLDFGPDGADDDLFGPSSPSLPTHDPTFPTTKPSKEATQDPENDSDLASEHDGEETQELSVVEPEEEEQNKQLLMQQRLFAETGKAPPITDKENMKEWVKLEYPDFDSRESPYINRLFPPRSARWMGKAPLKPPKPIRPGKVTLDIEQDQKLLFNSATATAAVEPRRDVVRTQIQPTYHEDGESAEESDPDEPPPGGVTLQDLEFLCTDFDTLSGIAPSEVDPMDLDTRILDSDNDVFGFDDFGDFEHPRKKQRCGMDPHDIVTIHPIDLPFFDDPERATAKLAGKVVLDLNDPQILVEEVDLETLRAKVRPGEKTSAKKTIKDRLNDRFKTSNDAEYDLLKQNHQHKIRGQLGHMTIDHSLPAIRLQYPYYQVRLSLQELRNYHRKRMQFKHAIAFNKPNKIKRKHLKAKTTKDIYANTKDLSLADNSTSVLFEYSEEHPLMLSQAGMGNKIVNYYRRKDKDDTYRPKQDLGETSILLPEDKSPFYIFGQIGNGETITALYNSMYRAPIFAQEPSKQDFLIIRETTGMGGQMHYLRNVDNMFVVGQELPSTTIPGTHSRMVTTAAKNRLKAISFRIARRKKSHRIRVEDVTRHFPDTSDMQNRQKMKEFMVFSKEHKEWEMKPGELVPDEDVIQGLLKPEDICLLESMQVGAQYLHDAGYGDDDDDDDKDKEDANDSIEQQLAPWRTTKNFIHATQGKAMLRLFGEGDPSGRGEAFSFIKTSMKGGFKAIGGSAQDAITLKKELGGHSYNVARQQRSYEESIKAIWDKQKASLSTNIEPTDLDMDGDVDAREDNYERGNVRATSMSGTQTPALSRRRDDETATSFSKRSFASQSERVLRIVRTVLKNGEYVQEEHIETDPAVIKSYRKLRDSHDANQVSLAEIAPTGNAEFDARQRKRLEEEIERLQKAKARRTQRERTKAALNAASPGGTAMSPDGDAPTPAGGKQVQATQRKCANCGQVGHIKTNKKTMSSSKRYRQAGGRIQQCCIYGRRTNGLEAWLRFAIVTILHTTVSAGIFFGGKGDFESSLGKEHLHSADSCIFEKGQDALCPLCQGSW